MLDMTVILAVFQSPMGWLKTLATLNRLPMSVTSAVFQLQRGRLKAVAT